MTISKEIIKALENDKISPMIGNPNGKIVIYEFFDYNCGYCKMQHKVITELINENKNVKIILKNFPIFPVSRLPAKATVATSKLGKTLNLHKCFFENHLLPLNYSEIGVETLNKKIMEKILKLANKIGINIKKLEEYMSSEDVEKEIDITKKIAHKLNIHGTPAFIIKGKVFPQFMNLDEIKEIIK